MKCSICGKELPDTVGNMDEYTHKYYPRTYHEPVEISDPFELGKQMAKETLEKLRKEHHE